MNILEILWRAIGIVEYRCKNCNGVVTRTTKQCPHCGVWLAYIECTRCGFVGSEEDFANDRCPRCGNVTELVSSRAIERSGCWGWLYRLLSPIPKLYPDGPDYAEEEAIIPKAVRVSDRDGSAKTGVETFVRYKVVVTCQTCNGRYRYRRERPKKAEDVGFSRCPHCQWLQTWMLPAWRRHWSIRVGVVVGLLSLLWTIPLLFYLIRGPWAWKDPSLNLNLPPETVAAVEDGLVELMPLIESLGALANGFLLAALVGALSGLLVYWVWNPNWSISHKLSRILGQFRHSAEPVEVDESDLPSYASSAPSTPPRSEFVDQFFGKPTRIVEETRSSSPSLRPKESLRFPSIDFSLAFMLALLLLLPCGCIDLLTRLFGFVRDVISWLNTTPCVLAVIDHLRDNLTPRLIWQPLFENPGRFIAALLMAVIVGGLLDKRWRRYTLFGVITIAALPLIQAGEILVPSEGGIPAALFAPIVGCWFLYNSSQMFDALRSVFGHFFTSGWLSDVSLVGHTSLLAWQPFSIQWRKYGRQLQQMAFLIYRCNNWPRSVSKKTIESLQNEIEALEEISGDVPRIKALASIKTAGVLRANGLFDGALYIYKSVLELAHMSRQLPKKTHVAALLGTGDILVAWGAKEQAGLYYEEALRQAEASGSRKMIARAADKLAAWHLQQAKGQGDLHIENALKLCQYALDTLRSGLLGEKGYYEDQAGCYLSLGDVYLRAGQVAEARQKYRQSVGRFGTTLNQEGRARSLLGIGQTYWSEYQTSAQPERDKPTESKPWKGARGILEHAPQNARLKKVKKAIRHFEKALRLVRRIHYPTLAVDIHRALMLGYAALDDLDAASRSAQRAVATLEEIQQGVFRESARIGYTEPYAVLYGAIVADCIQKDDLRGAMEWMERARSRVLVAELAKESALCPTVDDVPEDLLKKERRLLEQERNLSRELAGGPHAGSSIVQDRILGIRRQLEDTWKQIEIYDRGYIVKRRGQPLDWAGMTKLIAAHPVRCAAVEYFVYQGRLAALLLLPDETKPRLVMRGFPASGLEVLWQNRWWSARWKSTLNSLVEPLSRYLNAFDLLYVVPHSALHGVPLHAGKVGNSILLERAAIAYSPSLTALSYLRPRSSYQTCLAVGYSESDIDRKGFEEEANLVAALFKTKALTAGEATSKQVLARQRGADIVHIACHGEFDEQDPYASELKLADGPLTPRRLMQHRLSASLVVLSSCYVSRSGVRGIDETLGFAKVLLHAGASAVIAPSQIIDPEAATLFTKELYKNLIGLHMPPVFALRDAQLEIRDNPKYKIEDYWASCMLTGAGTTLNL